MSDSTTTVTFEGRVVSSWEIDNPVLVTSLGFDGEADGRLASERSAKPPTPTTPRQPKQPKAPRAPKLTLKDQRLWVEWTLLRPEVVQVALQRIYSRQTQDERSAGVTVHTNHKGFSAYDAEFGTSLAQSLHRYGSLTPKQTGYARKMMLHYWKQLVECAQQKNRLPTELPAECRAWLAANPKTTTTNKEE